MMLPNAESCRGPALANGKRPILWEVVDPLLRSIATSGALVVLSKGLDISRFTLSKRRAELNLPPLPKGRRAVIKLTKREQEVVRMKDEGMRTGEMADKLGTTPQAVSNIKRTIEAKDEAWERACKLCFGDGIRPCGSDGEVRCDSKKHSHVCGKCNGTGQQKQS